MSGFIDHTAPADEVLRQVADLLEVPSPNVDQICENLRAEFVLYEYQLSTISEGEWKTLGAPIGLAAAIRRLFMEEAPSSSTPTTSSAPTSTMLTSKSTYAQRVTMATKGVVPKQETSNPTKPETIAEDDNEIRKTSKTPKSFFQLVISPHHRLKSIFGAPFPVTQTFDRALLHSKSGEALKAHAVFTMEIGVVVSALLVGASVEMWGVFPMDSVAYDQFILPGSGEPYVPFPVAVIFHMMSFFSILTQLLSVFTYVGNLIVATAVAENKFIRFFQQAAYPISWNGFLFTAGIVCFMLNLGVLLAANIMATTSDTITARVCSLIVPAVIVPSALLFYSLLQSYMGRVAFNGFLFTENEPYLSNDNEAEEDAEKAAIRAENAWSKLYFDNISRQKSDLEVLGMYEHIKQLNTSVGIKSLRQTTTKITKPTSRKLNIGADYFPKYVKPPKSSSSMNKSK